MKVICFHPHLKEPQTLNIDPLPDLIGSIISDRKEYLEYHAHVLKSVSLKPHPHSLEQHPEALLDPMHHGFSGNCLSHVIELLKQFQHLPERMIALLGPGHHGSLREKGRTEASGKNLEGIHRKLSPGNLQ